MPDPRFPDYPDWPPDPNVWPNWNDPRVNTDLDVLVRRISELAADLKMEVVSTYTPKWSAGMYLRTAEGNMLYLSIDGDMSRDTKPPSDDEED